MLTIVEESVTFTKDLTDVKVSKLPGSACFECEFSKPNAPLTWYKDDKPIKNGAKYEIEARGRMHTLTIKGVDSEDDGVYKAMVKNAKTTAKLFVQSRFR